MSFDLNLPYQNVSMVNEGGSIEVDGRGTLMAKRSSILNPNRNPGMTQAEAESYFEYYLGVTNFIWLDGKIGGDVTDDHIDGTARFAHGDTIVIGNAVGNEHAILSNATDVDGNQYQIVDLPLTQNIVTGTLKGLYINYYVGNDVVIVPKYNDPNDDVAKNILQGVYPTKTMVQIDFMELYKDGGVVHCVTKEEPVVTR